MDCRSSLEQYRFLGSYVRGREVKTDLETGDFQCPQKVGIHPGEILQHEFLIPMKITQAEFAKHLGVPFQRVN